MHIEQRLRIVQATSGHSWGLTQQNTTWLVNQYVLSSGLYGAPAHCGLATKQGLHPLDVAYNSYLRLSTGCTKTTPIHRLCEVAGPSTIQLKVEYQAACIANIAKRHSVPTPANALLQSAYPVRIRETGETWRQMAERHLPPSPAPLSSRPPPLVLHSEPIRFQVCLHPV